MAHLRDPESHAQRACVQRGEDGRERVAVQPVHGALVQSLHIVIGRCFRTHLGALGAVGVLMGCSKSFRAGEKERNATQQAL
eukprot:scaffold65505_cov45-Phaeocystis_antarctica.AAC.3